MFAKKFLRTATKLWREFRFKLRVLVTGAAGFIGSHVLQTLVNDRNIEVVGLDSFDSYYSPDYKLNRLQTLVLEGTERVARVDVCDEKALQKFFADFRPDQVVHLAAQAGVRIPVEKWGRYTKENLLGFSNVIQACVMYETSSLIYASSSSVYGRSNNCLQSEKVQSLNPDSFYGATKVCNEVLARTVSKVFGLRTRGIRYFTVYGPWGRPDMAYFRIAAAIMGNTSFTLSGDGSIERDFTYIDDAVQVTLKLLSELSLRDQSFYDVVNLGGGSPHSMKQLIDLFEMYQQATLSIIRESGDTNDVPSTRADVEYLKSIVGPYTFVPLHEGIERFVEWISDSKFADLVQEWVESSKSSKE